MNGRPALDAEVEDEWTTVDGVRLHAVTAGDGDPPVLLLHGGVVDAATLSWGAMIGPLARDRRVVALDLPGYGKSDRPDASYSTSYHVELVDAFLDECGLDTVSMVGTSLGGSIGLGLAFTDPDRVDTLVLADAYGLGRELPNGTLTYVLSRVPALNKLGLAILRRSRWAARASLQNIVHDLDSIPPAVVDHFYQLLQHPEAGKAYRRWRREEVGRRGFRTDYTSRLERLDVPTLLVHGAEDPVFPVRWSRRAADRLPNGEVHVIPECGHWAPREVPETFNALVTDFVTGESSG